MKEKFTYGKLGRLCSSPLASLCNLPPASKQVWGERGQTHTGQIVGAAGGRHAGDGLLGQVVELGALALGIGGRATDRGRRGIQARLRAAGNLRDEVRYALGGGGRGE